MFRRKYSGILFLIGIVLISSLFWRFVNYSERWTLSQDQARDGIIGLYSISHGVLPLVGPPSSAGAFSFGPFYYWLIALFTLIIPAVNGPWIGFTLLSASTALIFFYLGYLNGGKSAGFIYGILAAFSSGLIFHSPDMLNPVPVSFLTSLSFLFVYVLSGKKKIIYAFLTGLVLGIAVNFHYQALGLLILIPLVSMINNYNYSKKLYVFILSILGLFASFLSLIYFNFTHRNTLLSNFLQFLTNGPEGAGNNSNLINDLFVFWPQFWGETLINTPFSGYLFLLLFLTALFLRIGSKKSFDKPFYAISSAALFQVIFLFIYSGVRLPIYLIVFQPFFVFLTGWSVSVLFKTNKYLGLGILTLIILVSIPGNWQIVNNNKSQVADILSLKNSLDSQITGPVRIYGDEKSNMIALPLYYLYLKENRISDSGQEIVTCENRIIYGGDASESRWSCPENIPVIAGKNNFKIYLRKELTGEFPAAELNQDKIYNWLSDAYE